MALSFSLLILNHEIKLL